VALLTFGERMAQQSIAPANHRRGLAGVNSKIDAIWLTDSTSEVNDECKPQTQH